MNTEHLHALDRQIKDLSDWISRDAVGTGLRQSAGGGDPGYT